MSYLREQPISWGKCHGCGNEFDDCECEEIDAEMNTNKHPDDDPEDGCYFSQAIDKSTLGG
jgi:hypothetical protein